MDGIVFDNIKGSGRSADPGLDTIALGGIDASGFHGWLAALGALRLLHEGGVCEARLSWTRGSPCKPVLSVPKDCTWDDLLLVMHKRLINTADALDELGVRGFSPDTSRDLAVALRRALSAGSGADRLVLDLLAGWGSDAVTSADAGSGTPLVPSGKIQKVQKGGSGGLVRLALKSIRATTPERLDRTLTGWWAYDDHVKGESSTLGIDPNEMVDSVRHGVLATRIGRGKGEERIGKRPLEVAGNSLAAIGMSLVPCGPVATRYGNAVGAALVRAKQTPAITDLIRWPVWTSPLAIPEIRFLLLHPAWQSRQVSETTRLVGVHQVFEAAIISKDKRFSLTFGKPLWTRE